MTYLLLALSFVLAGSAHPQTITIPAPEPGREAATVHLPEEAGDRQAWPVVLLLHGFTNQPDYVNGFFGINNEVAGRGFVLVVPKGRKNAFGARYWSATDGCCDFEQSRGDDVAYLTGLLREVSTRIKVDAARVYVVGHSNGGFMAHRLACDTSGLFAAAVSFAGTTWKDSARCLRLDALSLLQIHAEDDGTIKYAGDRLPALPPYPGSEETVARFVERNGCASPPVQGSLDTVAAIPGMDTQTRAWSSCASGAEVALWKIQPHRGSGYNAHKPGVTPEFRAKLLDFLLSKSR